MEKHNKVMGTKHTIESEVVGKFTFGWIFDKKNPWIYGKFNNPTLAKKHFKCNPYTGKFNFHIYPLLNLRITLDEIKDLHR